MVVLPSGTFGGGIMCNPIIIRVPGQQGGPPKTVTSATKPAGQTLLNASAASQIVAMPTTGLQQVTQHQPASQSLSDSESSDNSDDTNPENII